MCVCRVLNNALAFAVVLFTHKLHSTACSPPNQTPLAPLLHGVALSTYLTLYTLPTPTPHTHCSPASSSLPVLPFASYANTRNIFQMLFAFALHTIFACAACVPAFSHFSIFHVRFVVVADDTAHTHTYIHSCIEALCCLHFHYFFLYDIFLLFCFFFSLNNSHLALQGSAPAKRKLSSLYTPLR